MRPKAGMAKHAKGRRLAGAQAYVPWTALWLVPSYSITQRREQRWFSKR